MLLRILTRIDRYFEWMENKILIIIPLLLTILCIFAVFNRYLFGMSMSWYEEISIFFYMLIVYWGSSKASNDETHFTLNFLKDKLKGKSLAYSKIIIWAICLLVTLLGVYFGIKMSLIITMKTVSLKIPKSIIIASTLMMGFFGMSLRYSIKIINELKYIKENSEKVGN